MNFCKFIRTCHHLPIDPLVKTTLHVDSQGGQKRSIGGLRIPIGVKQQRVIRRTPTIWVPNTPNCNANAFSYSQAAIENSEIVSWGGVDDVEFCYGNFRGA